MKNINLISVNAFVDNGYEFMVFQYEEDGEYNEFELSKQFNTRQEWKGVYDEIVLKELLKQFVDRVINER